jgi:hypothetical protein
VSCSDGQVLTSWAASESFGSKRRTQARPNTYIASSCHIYCLLPGTPAGVGHARKPPVYLQPKDTVEAEIEGIGVLRNPVVAEKG